MEMHPIFHFPQWPLFFFSSSPSPPPNYVHWTETPSSHLYTASLPGVRKEEIRVEIENSTYLLIRTELHDDIVTDNQNTRTNLEEGTERTKQRSFNRKFRLPVRVDLDGITARYENGVLTVIVPRLIHIGRLRIGFPDLDCAECPAARAA